MPVNELDIPPLWGNFVYHADKDLLAFSLLLKEGELPLGFYHGVQAIEKYMKALALSELDKKDIFNLFNTKGKSWIKTHDLNNLENHLPKNFIPSMKDLSDTLKRLMEFDQATRYPWVERTKGNGFSGSDIEIIAKICKEFRNALPVKDKKYPIDFYLSDKYYDNLNDAIKDSVSEYMRNFFKDWASQVKKID